MDIVDAALELDLVFYGVFPIPPLPNPSFALGLA
jgi:hypothetical protein